jgi:hypothetical protein
MRARSSSLADTRPSKEAGRPARLHDRSQRRNVRSHTTSSVDRDAREERAHELLVGHDHDVADEGALEVGRSQNPYQWKSPAAPDSSPRHPGRARGFSLSSTGTPREGPSQEQDLVGVRVLVEQRLIAGVKHGR